MMIPVCNIHDEPMKRVHSEGSSWLECPICRGMVCLYVELEDGT